jgi:hypothetical protein
MMRRGTLAGVCLPFLIIIFPLVLLLRLCGFVQNISLSKGSVILADITPRGARIWRYSTTLGRVILVHPDVYEAQLVADVLAHEHVHVRQHEDNMLVACLLGIALAPFLQPFWLAFVVWWSGGLWPLLSYVTAGIRYGKRWMYMGAEIERSAYAQNEYLPPTHRGVSETFLERNDRVMETVK